MVDIEKKVTDKKGWFYLALGCVIVSILSLLFPILTVNVDGFKYRFNIIDFIVGGVDFQRYILNSYVGPVVWDISIGIVLGLSLLVIVALACAIVGLITLRAQRPNTKNFVLTIIGMVGVSIPSLIIIICVLIYGKYFYYQVSLGVAPIIAPIAIIISIIAVVRRKNKAMEQLRKEVEAEGLIYKAGDL